MLAPRSICKFLFLMTGLLLLSCLSAKSAPITFGFEAVVGPPRSGFVTLDLPFQFKEGDIVTGQFTFDPVDAHLPGVMSVIQQPHPLKVVVDGYSLEIPGFEVVIVDDLTQDESPEIDDVIRFRRAQGEYLSGSNRFYWLMGATFLGDRNVFTGADIPSNVEAWRQLLPASLTVTITDIETLKGAGFIATITSLTVVPEPRSQYFAIATLVCGLIWTVRHRWGLERHHFFLICRWS